MDGCQINCHAGYTSKVIKTPYGKVTVHRPVLDDKTRAQRYNEVERALAQVAKEITK